MIILPICVVQFLLCSLQPKLDCFACIWLNLCSSSPRIWRIEHSLYNSDQQGISTPPLVNVINHFKIKSFFPLSICTIRCFSRFTFPDIIQELCKNLRVFNWLTGHLLQAGEISLAYIECILQIFLSHQGSRIPGLRRNDFLVRLPSFPRSTRCILC